MSSRHLFLTLSLLSILCLSLSSSSLAAGGGGGFMWEQGGNIFLESLRYMSNLGAIGAIIVVGLMILVAHALGFGIIGGLIIGLGILGSVEAIAAVFNITPGALLL